MEKKTKLTISGSAKKSIKNIEIAKSQGKNSVVIEKQTGKFSSRGGSFRSNENKPRTNSTFHRGAPSKSLFNISLAAVIPRLAEIDVELCAAPKGSYTLSDLLVKPDIPFFFLKECILFFLPVRIL